MKRFIFTLVASLIPAAVLAEGTSPGLAYSIARGGKLYDKWFEANSAKRPDKPNPAYPDSGSFKGKKDSDWRCKECHGWDYLGKDGAYGNGKHFTGISGMQNTFRINAYQLGNILTDSNHGYTESMLSHQDVIDLTNFLQRGTFDMRKYINSKTGLTNGNQVAGKNYYQTICAGCHDLDGKGEDTPPLGRLSNENPWETLHKIRNGQPGTEMPAMTAFNKQIAVDILSYIQTLPKE